MGRLAGLRRICLSVALGELRHLRCRSTGRKPASPDQQRGQHLAADHQGPVGLVDEVTFAGTWALLVAYFFNRYFVRLGFLDGRKGFVYHALQGFWYRFLVGAKIREIETALRGVKTEEEARREITRLTRQKTVVE